jgi:ABC-type branched-subunit amino acid transport system substrate-binding protein
MINKPQPVSMFISYAHEDEPLRKQFEKHLSLLQRQGLVSAWHDRQITGGTNWAEVLDRHLNSASIILLLISADFLASDYCYGIEMRRALDRDKAGQAQVIPIFLRPVDWKDAPFAHLQALPTNTRAITTWNDRDEAWVDVVGGIRQVIMKPLLLSVSTSPPIRSVSYTRNLPFTGRVDLPTRPAMPPHSDQPIDRSQQRPSFLSPIGKYKKNISFGILIVLVLLGSGYGWYLHSLPPIEYGAYCLSRWPIAMCPNGIGMPLMKIGNDGYRIGIADENIMSPPFFQPGDTDEENVEKKIIAENKKANLAKQRFTLILLTTLSTSSSDATQFQSVGLEDLRGAYIAQYQFNENSPNLKLKLLIGNLGTKNVDDKTASLVASQVVLLEKNGNADDNILGVIGLPFSTTVLRVLPTLHQYGVTVVSSAAVTDDLSIGGSHAADPSEFHRILPPNSQQTPYIQQFILEVLQPKSALMITSSDPYSTNLAEVLSNKLKDGKIPVDESIYEDGNISKNMSQMLEKLQKNKFDFVFFTGFPNDLDAILTQMKRQDIRLPTWIMGGGALYELSGYTLGNYAHPLIFPSFTFPDAPEAYAKKYQTAYKHAFNSDKMHSGLYGYDRAGPYSASEYDAVWAYIHAELKVGRPDVEEVRKALQDISFTGATGTTVFRRDSVDPDNKTLYIVCPDWDSRTHAVWTYYPEGKNKEDEPMSICSSGKV